jgi:3',5'-cyclic AMP phosphodiesterase CpdA
VFAALAWWATAPPAAEVLPAQDFNAANLARLAGLNQNPVTFAVFGDSRNHNGVFPALLKAVAQDKEMDFAVHLGDLVRDGKLWEYKLFFQELQALGPLPLITVVGNHELKGDGRRLFGKIFGPTNFSCRLGEHAFVVLNNTAREGLTEAEWDWLAGTLKTFRHARRRLLFLHVPLFDPRPDRAKPHAMAPGPARRLLGLLKEHDVSHVFAGHIHGYFTGDWEGLPYTISGGAGVSLAGSDPRHYFHHYLKVRLDGEAMRVEVKPLNPRQ